LLCLGARNGSDLGDEFAWGTGTLAVADVFCRNTPFLPVYTASRCAFRALHLDPLNLGLVFTFMGVGSLAGAVLILEPARKRLKPNQMTVLAGIALAASYALMAVIRQPQVFLLVVGRE
jgi:hypothetical protein